MSPRVTRRATVKAEGSDGPEMVDRTVSPSVTTMPRPAAPPPQQDPVPHQVRPEQPLDMHSAAISFARSGAPSITTNTRSAIDQTPLFLETRIRQGNMWHETPQSPLAHAQDGNLHQGSFARPAFADIGAKLKACNDTLGNLQQLGIQHVAKLPELVLVGDQSAGKSSLMSGLAELNLPRSGGVCTRCPIHIRMASSNVENFSCTVSLQQDYDYRPRDQIRVSDVTEANPFPPWVEKAARETIFFKTIEGPDDSKIEEVLKWAQIAILSPTKPAELFVPDEGAIAKEYDIERAKDYTDAQFSPNIVALEMKGPGLPDLSFYDLPGVFLSPGNEQDEYVVKVVQNLARAYIRRKEAIIMWALPMNHDLENSIILPIIRKARATDRTIGVITKADMLQESNINQWVDVLDGKKQSVKHGYFLTSLPPGQPLESARDWEENFFKRRLSTWPLAFDKYSPRCGVDPLRDYISQQLGEAFSQSLPSIKVKVRQRLDMIQQRLSQFPELPSNVEYQVRSSFTNVLRKINSDVKDPQMSSQWDRLNEQFRSCIMVAKPGCIVTETTQTIDLDSDAESIVNTPSKRPRPSDSTMKTPAIKRPRPDLLGHTPIKAEAATGTPARPTPPPDPSPFLQFSGLGKGGLDLREIRSVILQNKKVGMPPDLVPVAVYEFFSLRAVRKWQEPLKVYLDKTVELLTKILENALESSLQSFKSRLLYKDMRTHLQAFLNNQESLQRARLSELYDAETYSMFTMNNDICAQFRIQELEIIERARTYERLRANALIPWETKRPDPAKMSAEARAKEIKMLVDGLAKLPGKDQYDVELKVAAHVRAYYLTAATFFVEGITKDVNARLFRVFTQDAVEALEFFLGEKLGIMPYGTPEAFARLMEEDAATARERENLKKELAKLERAMASINALESDTSGAYSEAHMYGTNFHYSHMDEEEEDEDMGVV